MAEVKLDMETYLAVFDARAAVYGVVEGHQEHAHMMQYWVKCFSRACKRKIIFW